jgi:hypothetical protein
MLIPYSVGEAASFPYSRISKRELAKETREFPRWPSRGNFARLRVIVARLANGVASSRLVKIF